MPDENIIKVERPDDPRRCQAAGHGGQCMNKAVDGGSVCYVHGGAGILKSQQKRTIYDIRRAEWKARMSNFLTPEASRTLHEEAGVMRIMFEEVLNKCTTPEMLMQNAGFLQQQVQIIERLVTAAHKLEKSAGNILDKSSAIQFALEVVATVQRHQANAIAELLETPPEGRDDALVQSLFQEKMIDAITKDIENALARAQAKINEQDE